MKTPDVVKEAVKGKAFFLTSDEIMAVSDGNGTYNVDDVVLVCPVEERVDIEKEASDEQTLLK